jgi:hypothetical protein
MATVTNQAARTEASSGTDSDGDSDGSTSATSQVRQGMHPLMPEGWVHWRGRAGAQFQRIKIPGEAGMAPGILFMVSKVDKISNTAALWLASSRGTKYVSPW